MRFKILLLGIVLLLSGCGTQTRDAATTKTAADGGSSVVATKTPSELLVRYFAEVLAPSVPALRVEGTNAWYAGLPHDLNDRSDAAMLASTILFDAGNALLTEIDDLGLEPFDVYPLCVKASKWAFSLATLDTETSDAATVLQNVLRATDASSELHRAVDAELESVNDTSKTPPQTRLDHDRCLAEARQAP